MSDALREDNSEAIVQGSRKAGKGSPPIPETDDEDDGIEAWIGPDGFDPPVPEVDGPGASQIR